MLEQVNQEMPSVVIAARTRAGERADARITVDGKPFLDRLDGRPAEIDPGEHVFVVQAKGLPTIERKVLVLQGQKDRVLTFDLEEPSAGPSSTAAAPSLSSAAGTNSLSRPVPWTTYALGGLGVASLAVFGYFGATYLSERRGQQCEPACTSEDHDTAARHALVADVTMGVGLVALGAATFLYLSRPTRGASSGVGVSLGARVSATTRAMTLGVEF